MRIFVWRTHPPETAEGADKNRKFGNAGEHIMGAYSRAVRRLTLVGSLTATTPAFAETSTINAADTSWMIVATALVLMMTIPGLALFYAGMVRKKNVLATMAITNRRMK